VLAKIRLAAWAGLSQERIWPWTPVKHKEKILVLGWLIGLGIVGAIVLVLAGAGSASKSGSAATWVSWVKIVLGVLLLLVAARQFRSRPHGDEQPQMPKWMATIDKTTPPGPKAALAAVVLQPAAASQLAQAGQIHLDGDQSVPASLAALMDEFDPNFNIVTP
jgi:hypothetical protein